MQIPKYWARETRESIGVVVVHAEAFGVGLADGLASLGARAFYHLDGAVHLTLGEEPAALQAGGPRKSGGRWRSGLYRS